MGEWVYVDGFVGRLVGRWMLGLSNLFYLTYPAYLVIPWRYSD